MRILGNPQITKASVTATNITSAILANKLKTFQLTDSMRTISNITAIDFVFNAEIPLIDTIALCGTNLTENASIVLTYSDVNIEIPDAITVLDTFSILNQVLFLNTALQKKYWRLTITDSALDALFFGYLYIGKYFQPPYLEFGHAAASASFASVDITPTGQGYGSKLYNALPVDFTLWLTYEQLEEYMQIKEQAGLVDPVVLIEYEEAYNLKLYRPKYGRLVSQEIPYPMTSREKLYSISDRLEELF